MRKFPFRKRVLLMIAALMMVLGAAMGESVIYDWMIFENLTEPLYTKVASSYTSPLYAGGAIPFSTAVELGTGEETEVSIMVEQAGLYEIWFAYENTSKAVLPTELTLRVDGEIPFFELRRLKFESRWIDDGEYLLDRYGNQVAATPYPMADTLEKGLRDSAGRTEKPFLFQLEAGEHTLSLTCNDGGLRVSEISLRAPVSVPEYQHNEAAGNQVIVLEAEGMTWRNASDLRGAGEFSSELSPYDTNRRMINFLDGASFDMAGDEVGYTFTVEEAGYYKLGFFYRQNVKSDFPVYVDVKLDGAFPSAAAQKVPFSYGSGFQYTTAMAGGQEQTIYLSKGEHTLSLAINTEILTPIYEEIDQLLSEINGLALEVVRLTGGVTTDKYRDYNITTYIPDLQNILLNWADRCDAMVESMRAYGDGGSTAHFGNLTVCAAQLRDLARKPEDLPRRRSELNTGANSVARMMAQQLTDMTTNDLSIDQIYLYQNDGQLPAKAGFFTKTLEGVKRFFTSFTVQDYSANAGQEGNLQVWMARPRQYVEILQNMIDTKFTPQTGIRVDLSIMQDPQKLVLANASGDSPDVALSVQYVLPSYLDIRGALYDLTNFDDFAEVAARFPSGLFVPYILEDGVYAIPETINFWVMFYRTDVFAALGIPVPSTMDEVKAILPELQRRNMNFYFPTAGMAGMKVFPGTLPLILQSGGSLYGDTIGNTTLDSEESLKGFRELTDLFTIYNMPADVPAPGFYQQFRDGTLPIGIADLATYNLLLNAAPELASLWNIAVFPGLENEEGEIERWTTGGAETDVIFADSEMLDESWEFLKWWSSAEVQAEFGNTLQSTYGSEYIWNTANKEAFAQLPIQSSHKQVILEQTEWMTEAPWVLGTYMLERELSNAYIAVVVDGTEARRAMDTAVKRINRETYRKLEEFGYYKDGVMVKDFKTPSMQVILDILDEAGLSEGGNEK